LRVCLIVAERNTDGWLGAAAGARAGLHHNDTKDTTNGNVQIASIVVVFVVSLWLSI